MATFEELVAEAQAAPVSGWDFSWLTVRSSSEDPLPWDYRAEVARYAAQARSLLDMGTGGGEWLVTWAVPGFTVERFAGRLRELHGTPAAWPVVVRQRRFLVVATKPDA